MKAMYSCRVRCHGDVAGLFLCGGVSGPLEPLRWTSCSEPPAALLAETGTLRRSSSSPRNLWRSHNPPSPPVWGGRCGNLFTEALPCISSYIFQVQTCFLSFSLHHGDDPPLHFRFMCSKCMEVWTTRCGVLGLWRLSAGVVLRYVPRQNVFPGLDLLCNKKVITRAEYRL